ncbi:unnamed protein product [Leptidea sinapis]|uniref:LYR motif-containing protein 9 n=1 Tax=Leptidea sinapis TaxID=189913 RepID=A0A5E4PQU0_9NEOP|nr:unnamed protein product [Leptidea sinapis]
MLYNSLRFLSNDATLVRVMSSLQLYKYLLRKCETLPPDACKHYKFAIKQSYKQHKTETDSERVREIIAKSIQDAEWIVKKYAGKE